MLAWVIVASCMVVVTQCQDQANLTFAVAAINLQGTDTLGKIDPVVRLYESHGGSEWVRLDNSEMIAENENPEWVKVFWYPWRKGRGQKLKFEVHDQDAFTNRDKIGEAVIDVDNYVAGGQNLVTSLDPQGRIRIQKTTPIRFKLSARRLPMKDRSPWIFNAFRSSGGKSDPYVKCYFRRNIWGDDIKFASTSVIDNVEDADWDEVIEFGNYQRGTGQYLRFKVKDSDNNQDDDIGVALVKADSFVQANIPWRMRLHDEAGQVIDATLTITPIHPEPQTVTPAPV